MRVDAVAGERSTAGTVTPDSSVARRSISSASAGSSSHEREGLSSASNIGVGRHGVSLPVAEPRAEVDVVVDLVGETEDGQVVLDGRESLGSACDQSSIVDVLKPSAPVPVHQ